MPCVRVVPWRNAAEFIKVKECLFSHLIDDKKWAVETIAVWESKCHPSLPTAIESTFLLTSAVIQDILYTNQATLNKHTDLQMVYGTAVTRFVGLTCEMNRNKDAPTYSTAQVAKMIGIPSYIVDTRNESCHSVRPSLSAYRASAHSALNYLKASYWDKEAARVKDHVKSPPIGMLLASMFQEYICFHEDMFSGKTDKVITSDNGESKVNPDYMRILKSLDIFCKRDKHLFIKVLISDGIFIPSDNEFKKFASVEEYASFNDEYFVDDIDMMDYDDDDDENYKKDYLKFANFESKSLPEIPEKNILLWEPVIALLNKYDVVPLFMEALLRSVGNRSTVGQKIVISWVLKLLRINNACSFSVDPRSLKKIFRRKTIVPNWSRMLYAALVNCSKYTFYVLPLLMDKNNLQREAMHRLIGLTAIKLGMTLPKGDTDYYKLFHTAKELQDVSEYQSNYGKEELSAAASLVSSCPDNCYKLWPTARIINPIKDEEDEEMEMDDIFKNLPRVTFPEECNKNEDVDKDDEYWTYRMSEEPNLKKILRELEVRDSLVYKKTK